MRTLVLASVAGVALSFSSVVVAGTDAVEQVRPMSFEYRLQYLLYRLLPNVLFKPICNLMYRMHILLTFGK